MVDGASGRVGPQGITGEAVTFDKHLIDFVECGLAMARRISGPEWRPEFQARHNLPPQPPAGETPCLARQIKECRLEGLESAAKLRAIHEAIRQLIGTGFRPERLLPQGCHAGIVAEDKDARQNSRWGIST